MCKHEYKLYNVSEYYPFARPIFAHAKYDFVCKRCGKEKSIKSLNLQDELMDEKTRQAKRKVMDPNYHQCDPEELTIQTMLSSIAKEFRGGFVKIVKEKYLKKGFDLNEINEGNRYGQHLLIKEE